MEFHHTALFMLVCLLLTNPTTSQRSCDRRMFLLNRSSGFIKSQNYPRNYRSNTDFTYCLSASDSSTSLSITLTFVRVILESHSTCGYDYLAIYDGPSTTSPQIKKLCGDYKRQFSITSSGSSITIKFHSDRSQERRGFSIAYTTGPSSPYGSCSRRIQVTRSSSGLITSPHYPLPYPPNSDCIYSLYATQPSDFVSLLSVAFDLEGHSICSFDYLAVYDGPNTTSSELAKFCGSIQKRVGRSGSGRFLTMKFHSDASKQGNGFSVVYTAGRVTSLGSGLTNDSYTIPNPPLFHVTSLTETSKNIYNVLGRNVHLSVVHRLLSDSANRRFPITQTTTALPQIELVIRADSVYLDQSLNFQGLKKLTIKARKLVSNGKSLSLQAPEVCQTLNGTTCSYLGKAPNTIHGRYGRNGIASPFLEIILNDLQGNVYIESKGSNGNVGEAGGDGNSGADRTWQAAGLTEDSWCTGRSLSNCGSRRRGRSGPNGGNGMNGVRAGQSGSGGDANSVNLITRKLSGYVNLKQLPGSGGVPAVHGFGGRGGDGGTGGCGMYCDGNAWSIFTAGFQCQSERSCDSAVRGYPGNPGRSGRDGYEIYPPPAMGSPGRIGSSFMRTTSSVKRYFQGDTNLLRLMQRHAESIFQRNTDVRKAVEIFNFILSIANESSALHQEASFRLKMIDEGFNYYGHTEDYAPDLHWSDLSDRVDSLLEAGKSFEDSYNRVMDEVEDVTQVSSQMQSVITISIRTEQRVLGHDEAQLREEKRLYVESLKQLEKTMKDKVLQIKDLLPSAIRLNQPGILDEVSDALSLIVGLVGYVEGAVTESLTSSLSGALMVVDTMNADPTCNVPTITDAARTLQDRLSFGFEYQAVEAEELDFSRMNFSAVPIIMRNDLARNKEVLTTELRCIFNLQASDVVANLERLIKGFYRDAGSRISLMDRIMNIDVQLKKISYSRSLLAETQQMVDQAAAATQNSLPMEIKMSFTDYMFSLYQEQENTIMRAIYELSKAYQFTCLWKFDAIEKYNNIFSSEGLTSNLNSLEGMSQLHRIKQELENQRNIFRRFIASSSAGPTSHIYRTLWEFQNATHPEIFKGLHTDGRFSLNFELDPDDPTSAGCANCYNGRLMALYIELDGKDQPSNVPNITYVKISHMGDSVFLVLLNNGTREVEILRQTPEHVDRGKVMCFDRSQYVTSVRDRALENKFMKEEHIVCDNSETFFGRKPCKSPYATYVITVPRSDDLPCSLDGNDLVSGTNCQDLDFTRFSTIKVYAKVRSWSNYPVQPDQETLRRFARALKTEEKSE